MDTINNETGAVVQRLSYDAFGKRRNANGTDAATITAQTTRGFTRHEHDDEVGLVNMNAREYDPLLGRFATPDAIVQFAHHSQSYNRNSYVHNNPLSFTDPTGRGLGKWLKKTVQKVVHGYTRYMDWHVRAAKKAMENPYVRTAVAMWAGYQMGLQARFAYYDSTLTGAGLTEAQIASIGATGNIIGGAAGDFTSGAIAGGNLRSGFQGSLSGGLFGGVNSYTQYWSAPGQIGAKAFTGGVLADLQGGDFRTGFIYSGSSATAAWGYQKVVGYMATGDVGRPLARPDGTYDASLNGGRPPQCCNVFGFNTALQSTGNFLADFGANFFRQGGALSTVMNYVPGMPAVGSFHDTWRNNIPDSLFNNIITMPYSAVVTYGALLDGPLSIQLAVYR